MRRVPAILLPWMAACPPLLAQPGDPQVLAATPADADRIPTFYAIWENDGGALKPNHNADRHYTNGLLVGLSFHPDFANDLASALPDLWGGFGHQPATAFGLVAGQLMFTPDDIDRFDVIEDDRPFAGYLFVGGYLQRESDTDRIDTLDHLQLDIGVIGNWSQAEWVQDYVHQNYGGDEVNGWDNQLDNEVTVQFTAKRKWRVPLNPIEFDDAHRIDAEFIPHLGVALGTVHRNAEAGATLRLGVNLPKDFGPSLISDLPAATGRAGRGWSFYGFGQVVGRVVEYNHFLEGSDFQDEVHTVEEEPLFGEVTGGVALGYRGRGWTASVQYSQTFMTKEFKGQSASDDFATLALTLGARF